jgi:PadR family transcriptional regulator, regulatory protein AphA
MRRTGTTAHAILGLLALRPAWSAYELSQQLRRNMRFFWPRAESRIYADAKALVDRGWASSETVEYGQRARTVYRITPAGQHALRTWLTSPVRGTALECEPLPRVFLGDLSGDDGIRSALEQVRADADAILDVGRHVAAEYLAGQAPFQDQVHLRACVFDFLSSHAMMLRGWADRTEQALDQWPAQTSGQRAAAALDTIRAIREHYPDETAVT